MARCLEPWRRPKTDPLATRRTDPPLFVCAVQLPRGNWCHHQWAQTRRDPVDALFAAVSERVKGDVAGECSNGL